MEREKKENIWIRKILRRKNGEKYLEKEIFGQQGRNERKKYLNGIIWSVEKKKNGKRKRQKYLGN